MNEEHLCCLTHLVRSGRRHIDDAGGLLHDQVVDDAVTKAVLLLQEVKGVPSMWNSQEHAVLCLHLYNKTLIHVTTLNSSTTSKTHYNNLFFIIYHI